MKKILWGVLALGLLLSVTTNVKALTNYKTKDWQTIMPTDTETESQDTLSGKTVGTVSPDGSNKTILTGNDEENGMKYGPYITGDGTTVKDGINEELYIALGTDKLEYGELFEISLSLKDSAYPNHFGYVNEVNVQTQNVNGTEIKVGVNGVGDVATITESGIYKYSWSIKRNEGKTHVVFTISAEDGTEKGKSEFDIEDKFPKSGDIQDITDNTTMRWLWFCNIKASQVELISKQDIIVNDSDSNNTMDSPVKVESDNVSQILKESFLKQFGNKYNTDVNINVEAKETKTADEEIKKVVAEKLKDAKIVEYLDINIDVMDSANKHLEYITELTEAIKLNVEIPKDIPAVADGYSRKYYIIRNHEGTIDIIYPTVSKDGKTLTFSSDKFSTYALAYTDSKTAEASNPDTSDKLLPAILIITISVLGVSCGYLLKKRFQ